MEKIITVLVALAIFVTPGRAQDTTVVADTLTFKIELIDIADRFNPSTGELIDSIQVTLSHDIFYTPTAGGDTTRVVRLPPGDMEVRISALPKNVRLAFGYSGYNEAVQPGPIHWSTDQNPPWSIIILPESFLIIARRGTSILLLIGTQ